MPSAVGIIDNLAELIDLTEEALLAELRVRYERDHIYTYIGDILIAVNPNKPLSIYGDQVGYQYDGIKLLSDSPPHIYAIATKVYQNLTRSRTNQCILVSGESGSGKTESSKMLVAQIVRVSKSGDNMSNLHQQIIEINPLLEAFGNAKTIINDNSSRFGKLIEMMFANDGTVIGAQVTEHMLEKSRVIHCGSDERSFHVFYYMFAGLTEREKRRYFLGRPEHYRIIDPGHAAPVFHSRADFDANNDAMLELKDTMGIVGFSEQVIDIVFALIAGLLHMTNIDFAQDPELRQVIVLNEDEVDYTSRLLSLQAEDLMSVFLATTSFVRGERIERMKSVAEACDGRDALAKTIYSRLFSWLVNQINIILHIDTQRSRSHSYGTVSILDMAGFENFPVNSFEQLCINVANEQFQNYFNTYIFTWELQEYETEGIKQPRIKFTNNKDLLNLVLERPLGLYAILEDECRLPNTTDLSFVEQLNKQFQKHDNYRKSKAREPVFTILHFAGQVTYKADGFLGKNREKLGVNFQHLMENSHNWLITELFTGRVSDTGTLQTRNAMRPDNEWTVPEWNKPNMPDLGPGETLSRKAGRKLKKRTNQNRPLPSLPGDMSQSNTTSSYFRNSLAALMAKLSKSEPHFIRCLKANNMKQFSFFDNKLVLTQLRSTGVLETTRIRRLGYPSRIPFKEFVRRYKMIGFPLTADVPPSEQACFRILQVARLGDCEIGKSKVFLKYWHVDHLDLLLDQIMSDIVIVQKTVRTFLARKEFLYLREKSVQYEDDVFLCLSQMAKGSDRCYRVMMSTNDQDVKYYQDKLREERKIYQQNLGYRGNEGHRYRPSRSRRNHGADYSLSEDPYPSPGILRHRRGYNDIVLESLNHLYSRWSQIDPDAWCKVIYMEYDTIVAKCYILEREVTIDGSYEEFDGERIGLLTFRNPDRDEATERIRSFIGKGLKYKRDFDGSVNVTRVGKNDITVKGFDDPGCHCFAADLLQREGKLPMNTPVKVFDMDEFKCQIGLEMKKPYFDEEFLRHQSIISFSFIQDTYNASDTPCWLMIINIHALRAINDPVVRSQVEQRFAELTMRSEEDQDKEMEKQQLAYRNNQRRWSKLEPRQGVKGKEAPLRKTRLELMRKGIEVKDHLTYAWDLETSGSKKRHRNISDLQEEFEEPMSMIGGYRESVRPYDNANSMISSALYNNGDMRNSQARRDWAKIKLALREESRQEEDAKLKAIQEQLDQ